MATVAQPLDGLSVRTAVIAIPLLLVGLGILLTPVQWYVAYVRLEEERRRQRTRRREATAPPVGTSAG